MGRDHNQPIVNRLGLTSSPTLESVALLICFLFACQLESVNGHPSLDLIRLFFSHAKKLKNTRGKTSIDADNQMECIVFSQKNQTALTSSSSPSTIGQRAIDRGIAFKFLLSLLLFYFFSFPSSLTLSTRYGQVKSSLASARRTVNIISLC